MNSLYGRRNGRMLETASLTTRGREATKSICRDAKLCAYAAFATSPGGGGIAFLRSPVPPERPEEQTKESHAHPSKARGSDLCLTCFNSRERINTFGREADLTNGARGSAAIRS